ncbi:MAG TPA: anthranilate synthase component I family protein [Tepidisphaeraceae bacterium]|nr:anthranilate synthase component I family protein [Tepidisphaeraceae bacterium]
MPNAAHFRLDSSLPKPDGWALPWTRSSTILRCDGGTFATTLKNGDDVISTWADPLDALAWLAQRAGDEPANTRWVGFISYELGRWFEKLPANAVDDFRLPLFAFALCRESAATATSIESLWPREKFAETLTGGAAPTSTFTPGEYRRAVAKVIDYIRAGDIFQANLAQRFSVDTPLPPASIYANLLKSAPASYGGLLDFGDFSLICNSPELFFGVSPLPDGSRAIVTRPIKGTRPRVAGMDVELQASTKDQAELNMIIDLERNDLGRICEIGSVRVTEPRTIEIHPTVYHGVATIEGALRREIRFIDILRAMFPGGSITGAPKIRAMEIIDELEPVRRGPYCGAIGYLAPGGAMQFNIAIRTMIARVGRVHISVGGGIVADSNPDAEYEETLVKARAMFEALGVSIEY